MRGRRSLTSENVEDKDIAQNVQKRGGTDSRGRVSVHVASEADYNLIIMVHQITKELSNSNMSNSVIKVSRRMPNMW